MTTIVGIKNRKTPKITFGADSLASGGHTSELANAKIWTRRERGLDWIFGGAGAMRYAQIVQSVMEFPEVPADRDILEYLQNEWMSSLEVAIKNHLTDFDKEKGTPKGRILIGVKGRLFTIAHTLAVIETIGSYAVIGSGEAYASAILWDLERRKSKLSLEHRIERAIASSAHFCGDVGGKIHFLKI